MSSLVYNLRPIVICGLQPGGDCQLWFTIDEVRLMVWRSWLVASVVWALIGPRHRLIADNWAQLTRCGAGLSSLVYNPSPIVICGLQPSGDCQLWFTIDE